MPAHGRVRRRDALERPARHIGREDDVYDMTSYEGAPRSDRVDHCDGPFKRQLFADAHFLLQLPSQGLDEALAAVDTSARQQPVLATPRLLVPAEKDTPLPAENGRDADARFERHQCAE